MKPGFRPPLWTIPVVVAAIFVGVFFQAVWVWAPDEGQLGGPIAGLNREQLKEFYKARELFKHKFSPEEGLGPLFNGRSCYECHGQPGIAGGEGQNLQATSQLLIGARYSGSPKSKHPRDKVIEWVKDNDVNRFTNDSGPLIVRRSITVEFPDQFLPEIKIKPGSIPEGVEFKSRRHAPPLFGLGLLEALTDDQLEDNELEEDEAEPELAGTAVSRRDLITKEERFGKFGYKSQQPSLLRFVSETLNLDLGITGPTHPLAKSTIGFHQFPAGLLLQLPPEPNDNGNLVAKLTYFVSLLAPPPRGMITGQAKRGERIFGKLDCAVCHRPAMTTQSESRVLDPNSPAGIYRFSRVKALDRQSVRAYSDLLLHDMGKELADGIPQRGATGGQWRTTPLWGLRFKKYYLHDGRTTDLSEAILAHGGQALSSRDAFKQLPLPQKEDLLAFLKSL